MRHLVDLMIDCTEQSEYTIKFSNSQRDAIQKTVENDCMNPQMLRDQLVKMKHAQGKEAMERLFNDCTMFRAKVYLMSISYFLSISDFESGMRYLTNFKEDMKSFIKIYEDFIINYLARNYDFWTKKKLIVCGICISILLTILIIVIVLLVIYVLLPQLSGRYLHACVTVTELNWFDCHNCNVINSISISEKDVVIIIGGYDGFLDGDAVDILLEQNDEESCHISSFPSSISSPSVFLHRKKVMVCGGSNNEKNCWKLDKSKWIRSNDLLDKRILAATVTLKESTYLFGGLYNTNSSEVLKSNEDSWIEGPKIPFMFHLGCGVQIDDDIILLIGGVYTPRQVAKLNINTKQWQNTSLQLHEYRAGHRCIVLNQKVIITGGGYPTGTANTSSTEVIDFSKKEWQIRYGGNMTAKRCFHGMAILNIDDVPKAFVFGGLYPYNNSFGDEEFGVEEWDDYNETWNITQKVKPTKYISDFGYMTVKNDLVC